MEQRWTNQTPVLCTIMIDYIFELILIFLSIIS